MTRDEILIIGAGIIGCSLALELAEESFSVTVVERGQPAREASWAAAGMLSPAAEHREHPALAELAKASAALYPDWLARLGAATAIDVSHRTEGTLQLAFTETEAGELRTLPGEHLSAAEVRRLEPGLSERIAAGVYLAGDHQVDNRRLLDALLEAGRRAGVHFRTGTKARELLVQAGRAVGVGTAEGARLKAAAVVNAAGCWAGCLGEVGARWAPTRPVRGQMLALQSKTPVLRHVVRSSRAYILPRRDDRLLVGSTMEDVGYDKSVTPEGLRGLVVAACEIVPAAGALPFAKAWAGLRPDSPDHLPILGATDIEGFFVATGHFRNGILLAPISARLLTEVILARRPSLSLEPFSPLRFGPG